MSRELSEVVTKPFPAKSIWDSKTPQSVQPYPSSSSSSTLVQNKLELFFSLVGHGGTLLWWALLITSFLFVILFCFSLLDYYDSNYELRGSIFALQANFFGYVPLYAFGILFFHMCLSSKISRKTFFLTGVLCGMLQFILPVVIASYTQEYYYSWYTWLNVLVFFFALLVFVYFSSKLIGTQFWPFLLGCIYLSLCINIVSAYYVRGFYQELSQDYKLIHRIIVFPLLDFVVTTPLVWLTTSFVSRMNHFGFYILAVLSKSLLTLVGRFMIAMLEDVSMIFFAAIFSAFLEVVQRGTIRKRFELTQRFRSSCFFSKNQLSSSGSHPSSAESTTPQPQRAFEPHSVPFSPSQDSLFSFTPAFELYMSRLIDADMLLENCSIILTPIILLCFHSQRHVWDLGYSLNGIGAEINTSTIITSCILQLMMEFFVDIIHLYFEAVFYPNSAKRKYRTWCFYDAFAIFLVLLSASGFVFNAFYTIPKEGHCSNYSYCSCDYNLVPEVCPIPSK